MAGPRKANWWQATDAEDYMFSLNDKDIKKFDRNLSTFVRKGVPFAARQGTNAAAWQTRTEAQQTIRNEMTLRNKWTEGSIRVEPTRAKKIEEMESRVGSLVDYMRTQEDGGVKKNPNIPTSFSAGQYGAKPRSKMPTRRNKMQNIKLSHRANAGRRKQRNAIKVRQAMQSGNKFVYLDLGRYEGIFRVTGGKRNPKPMMVHDMGRSSVTIPKNPWLEPSVKTVTPRLPRIYRDELIKSAKKLKVFR